MPFRAPTFYIYSISPGSIDIGVLHWIAAVFCFRRRRPRPAINERSSFDDSWSENSLMSSSDFGRAGANYVRRDVGAGGSGGVMLPPDFNRSVNLISPSGANYTLHITTAPPSDFQSFVRPCCTFSAVRNSIMRWKFVFAFRRKFDFDIHEDKERIL